MTATTTDASDQSMRAAVEGNLFAFWSVVSRSSLIAVEDRPDMLRYTTGVPFPLMNGILRARLDADDAAVSDALQPFRSRGLPMMWWTGPSTMPVDLPERLQRVGLVQAEQAPGMALDLEELDERSVRVPDLEIEFVASSDDCSVFAEVLAAGFEMPDFVSQTLTRILADVGMGPKGPACSFLGRLNGKPAATSTLALVGGIAGIYNVATLPDARGHGIGTAMTLAPLRHARDIGYRIAILHSSQMGFNVYHRLGFREYCKIGQYILER
jgi:ribosomal protein S18 acetylase RimI-like enzyme